MRLIVGEQAVPLLVETGAFEESGELVARWLRTSAR